MNANNSHYMGFKKTTYLLCLLCCTAAGGASSQTYDVVERRNLWNAGPNINGLRGDSVTVSYAEAYGKTTRGDFRDTYHAESATNLGVAAKTITHSGKISMLGAFSFDNMSGRDMCGSMFINPGDYPIDVMEFTPGRKELQSYSFVGGIAGDIAPNWRIGVRVDYASANYAKRKDLRHTNYRLDMSVAPSVMYHSGDWAVGMSYIFGRNTESVEAAQEGTLSSDYDAFLDKGLMYGAYETWKGAGLHLNESGVKGLPVQENAHAISVQAQWRSFYADIEYRHAAGEVGERKVIWFEFPTNSVTSHLGARFWQGDAMHFARLDIAWSKQKNNENVLSKDAVSNITTVIGSNRIYERESIEFAPEYELIVPQGEFTLGGRFISTKRLTTQMYPYAVSQSMEQYGIYASGVWHRGRFDLKAAAAFAAGSFSDKTERVDPEITTGEQPYRLTEYYDIRNEYLTAPRLTLGGGLRYNFHQGLYAQVDADYTRGFDLEYIAGTTRWSGALRFGYAF